MSETPDAVAQAREVPTFAACAVCGSTDQGDDYSAPGAVGLCFKHTPGAVPSDYGIELDSQYDEADALAFWLSYNLRGNFPLIDGAELTEMLRARMARDREAIAAAVRAECAADTKRLDWMQERYVAADFEYRIDEKPATALIIHAPRSARVGPNLRATIDTALEAHP